MFEHLINYGAYSEADAARIMHEIASALAFLHGVGVVHADLKPGMFCWEQKLSCLGKFCIGCRRSLTCFVVHFPREPSSINKK
jgi:serine/threonine protein kinase